MAEKTSEISSNEVRRGRTEDRPIRHFQHALSSETRGERGTATVLASTSEDVIESRNSTGLTHESRTTAIRDISSVKESPRIWEGELRSTGFSTPFVQSKTREMIAYILPDLASWEKEGTADSLNRIASIKNILERYVGYPVQQPEHRMLIGSLRLVVNKWSELTEQQINTVRNQLAVLQDGDITDKKLETFNRGLYKQGISFFSTSASEQEK